MNKKQLVIFVVVLTGAMCVHIFMSGETEGWRPTYDIGMKWLNFGILAFVLVKFLKDPLMNFLRNQKEELAKEIQELEEGKKKATDRIQEALKLVEKGDEHIETIKKRITDQGKKEKENIIREAHYQGKHMIKESKKKISSQILQAKKDFRADLIDAAIKLAIQRLPEKIKEEDNVILFNKFLESAK